MMRFTIFICILFISNSLLLAQDYNILDFGAVPDGKTMNTSAIQAAIDAAHKKSRGRVIIPEGKFLTGSFLLKSGVELHLLEKAVLLGSTNPDHYIKLNQWIALVLAEGQNNISITGKGQIDGQGRRL